jgi:hypothetical protein
VVDVKNPVQVIQLVLDYPGQQAGIAQPLLSAPKITVAHRDRRRTRQLQIQPRKGQTTLGEKAPLGRVADQLRIDQDNPAAIRPPAEIPQDDNAAQVPQLRRGQANPVMTHEQVPQAVGQAA